MIRVGGKGQESKPHISLSVCMPSQFSDLPLPLCIGSKYRCVCISTKIKLHVQQCRFCPFTSGCAG
jgi:hypothetical protein